MSTLSSHLAQAPLGTSGGVTWPCKEAQGKGSCAHEEGQRWARPQQSPPCSRDQVLSSLEGRGHRGNLETRSPSPSGGPATQSLSPRAQDPASRRESCPPSRARHKGQLENGCLWTDGLLPQKASPQASPGGSRMDQKASREFRPQILEDSLTLHAETCPLRTIGITVRSGEGQTKRVCASGTPLPWPTPGEAATRVLKDCLSSWFADKIQLP